MKRKKLDTIMDLVRVINSDRKWPNMLILYQIFQFQFRIEPINPSWPVNAETLRTLINAIHLRAMEKKVQQRLGFGEEAKHIEQIWDTAADNLVSDINQAVV